jgi:predicted metal-dependent HD superfamily phosphohydrolase
VAWVIRHIEELAAMEPLEHLGEVIAAAFYHDAVFEPTYPANERASARLARRDLATIGWDASAIDRVAAMIEATEHGATDASALDTAEPLPTDTAVLLDADLAVLGADPAGYATYAAGVRSEYRHLDDEEWRVGRSAVLEGFLRRPAIYLTDTATGLWERRARANLTAELAELEA